MSRWAVGALLGAAVATLAYRRRSLTADGAAAASVLGCLVFARGGWRASAALLAFFVSSTALSRVGEGRKRTVPAAQAKGARRDAWQVVANGGVASVALLAGGRDGQQAYVGALAAATADTWATELGMLSDAAPWLITTLRAVPRGTSGGVTLAGLAASLAGGCLVAATWAALGGRRPHPLRIASAGVVGSLIDSALGATIQAVYDCRFCHERTEEAVHGRCGHATVLVRGWPWATNDAINGLATAAGAMVGVGS